MNLKRSRTQHRFSSVFLMRFAKYELGRRKKGEEKEKERLWEWEGCVGEIKRLVMGGPGPPTVLALR